MRYKYIFFKILLLVLLDAYVTVTKSNLLVRARLAFITIITQILQQKVFFISSQLASSSCNLGQVSANIAPGKSNPIFASAFAPKYLRAFS